MIKSIRKDFVVAYETIISVTKFFSLCQKCYSEIFDLDEISATFWSAICSETYFDNPFHLIEPVCNRIQGQLSRKILDEKIRFLEENGYVLTHEVEEGVVILKLLGICERENMICVQKHT